MDLSGIVIIDLLPTETPQNHPVASDSVFNSFHVRVLDKAYDGILGLELRHKDTDTSIALSLIHI